MHKTRQIACLLFLLFLLNKSRAQALQHANDVHRCDDIPSFPILQEAKFTAVYSFEISRDGRPVKIQRVNVPFISKRDRPLIDCIASWHFSASKSNGTASFRFEWTWQGLEVRSGDLVFSIPPHRPKPVTH